MPGKSRHGKGKHYHYSKKGKAIQRQAAGTAPAAPSMNATPKPPVPAAAPLQPRVTAVQARAAENPYPYITSELKRIAVLAGIIIVILVILSIVLT
jgi:hypothetical protein